MTVELPSHQQQPRTTRAWLLSLSLHVVLVIGLSLLMTKGAQHRVPTETTRSVGIVLARQPAANEREYLEESQSIEELMAEDSPDHLATMSQSSAVSPESLVPPDLALPATTNVPLLGVSSVDAPRLVVSSGRPRLPGVDESAIVAAEQARLQAATARGPTTKLSIFGSKEAVGGSFVFLIDRSQSMGSGGLGVLRDAEQELVRVLATLQPEHRFQVAVYHDRSVYLRERKLLSATPENRALVPEFLGSKAAFGATEHERALMSALAMQPDVIFWLTDGGEPTLTDPQIRAIAKQAKGRTTIHGLHFGAGPLQDSLNFVARLAVATAGEYGYVDVSQRRR